MRESCGLSFWHFICQPDRVTVGNSLEPLLIAVSAIAFTVSYYTLYRHLPALVLPVVAVADPLQQKNRSAAISKVVFWLGLLVCIGFLSYFQYDKYQQEASYAAIGGTEGEEACCAGNDTMACGSE